MGLGSRMGLERMVLVPLGNLNAFFPLSPIHWFLFAPPLTSPAIGFPLLEGSLPSFTAPACLWICQ